jgi:hypothetical protein
MLTVIEIELNFGCLHPVACVRSGDGDLYMRLRNVTVVGLFITYIPTCFGRTTIIRQKIYY